jgi:hypothetical protein
LALVQLLFQQLQNHVVYFKIILPVKTREKKETKTAQTRLQTEETNVTLIFWLTVQHSVAGARVQVARSSQDNQYSPLLALPMPILVP